VFDKQTRPGQNRWWQYMLAFGVFVGFSMLGELLMPWIGYQAISLVYLLSIALLALIAGRGAVLFGTFLTVLGWSYLFAPPRYSFQIAGFYDREMVAIYFLVALTVGQMTALLRARRNADQQLREAEINAKVLSESEKLGRTLLNSVSHELRTPLTGISGAASTLRCSGPLTLVQEQLATEIEYSALRLNQVVQGLLNAARLQSGQIRPRMDWCDFSDVVRVSLRNTQRWLEHHPVQNNVRRGLPLIKADFVLMEQAVTNLLLNAARHTPAGTLVIVNCRAEDESLFLEVADRGPGVAPAQIARLFDAFPRAPNSRHGGMGLGLPIVKGFVEAQGGSVAVTNVEGGGVAFCITFPVGIAPEVLEEVA